MRWTRAVEQASLVRYPATTGMAISTMTSLVRSCKSIRGSDVDAALHHLARNGGEQVQDPRFIARRLRDSGERGTSGWPIRLARQTAVSRHAGECRS